MGESVTSALILWSHNTWEENVLPNHYWTTAEAQFLIELIDPESPLANHIVTATIKSSLLICYEYSSLQDCKMAWWQKHLKNFTTSSSII